MGNKKMVCLVGWASARREVGGKLQTKKRGGTMDDINLNSSKALKRLTIPPVPCIPRNGGSGNRI